MRRSWVKKSTLVNPPRSPPKADHLGVWPYREIRTIDPAIIR
jgi:hypothetical protein